jgi:hypothetical protein
VKIIHHFAWRPSDGQVAELLSLGFKVNAPEGLLALDVEEADPRWPAVRALAPPDVLDMVFTRSTESERSAASWLAMHATGHHGYPQPEDHYLEATYDVSTYCRACGAGAVQRAPFRFRRDPRLKPQRLLQLNWVFDVFFTGLTTWQQVFQPLGVGSRDVVLQRTGAVLPSIVQLETPEAPAPLNLAKHGHAVCVLCGRVKYLPHTRGFLPAFAGPAPRSPLAVSRELFGSGASAYRTVLATGPLYRAMHAANVRGVSFVPAVQPAISDAPAG